jgi:hypothetical protein
LFSLDPIARVNQNGDLIEALLCELTTKSTASSTQAIAERLNPLSIGLQQKVPILKSGARLFRVTNWCGKPTRTSDVGPPPPARAPMGRLNDVGQSVLYLADSPDTAFAEARATRGEFSLAEWRTQPARVALANGGIPFALLGSRFPNNFDPSMRNTLFGDEDDQVINLFRKIFTLPVDDDEHCRYRWSIACGLACGFAHLCERTAAKEIAGNTEWTGRHPFSGIAYASIRTDKEAINFAFNDFGQTLLRLDNVQWVERYSDGSFSGLDFASSWDGNSSIAWQCRPARLQIQPGGSARLLKVAETVWNYEGIDGNIPHFA